MDWTGILIGGVVAALVVFVWNAVAWMGLQHHKDDYRAVPNSDEVAKALAKIPPVAAWYSLPHFAEFQDGMKDPAFDDRMRKGPNAMLVVYPPGPPMENSVFAKGFAINLVEGFACAFLMALLVDQLEGLLPKMLLFGGLGGLVAVSSYVSQTVWAKYPLRFTITNTIDKVVGFALIGLVLHALGPSAPAPIG